jgi:hypothetical protein
VQRKAQLEEDARNHQLQIEREERARRQQLEQARIDRLLDEATSLRRATDIRAYVDALRTTAAKRLQYRRMLSSDGRNGRFRKPIALTPVKSARFLEGIEGDDNAN